MTILNFEQLIMKKQAGHIARGNIGTFSKATVGGSTAVGIPVQRWAMGITVSSDVDDNSLWILNGTVFALEALKCDKGLHCIEFPTWPVSDAGTNLVAIYSGGPGGTTNINLHYF